MGSFKLLFSDLDGTCVHYQDNEPFKTTIYDSSDDGRLFHARFPNVGPSPGRWTRVLPLPPSTTGAQGIISLKTIELYASLRAMGRKLILISGCRYSTLIQRLPYLPAADAYVCESGGRIFYPDKSLRTAAALKEDMDWRRKHWRAVGVSSPPDDSKFEENEKDKRGIPRLNLLWSYYNFLKLEGLDVDRRNYSTAFRVRISCHEWKDSYPASELYDELAYAENLGAVDIYPATSGKKNAALYLMEKFGGKKNGKDSVFMCGKLILY